MPSIQKVNHPGKKIKLPAAEESKKSSGPKPGISVFSDVYITAQLAQATALLHMNPVSFIMGSLLGATQPYMAYHTRGEVPKGTAFETNQQTMGEAFLASVSDPYFEKKAATILAIAVPILGIHTLNSIDSLAPLALPLTCLMGARFGRDVTQRIIQTIAVVYPEKS